MTQTNHPGRPGGTIDTPVGAQWPQGGTAPGSTDFGSATVVNDLTSRSETISGQPVENAHMQTRVEADHHGAVGDMHVSQQTRSRPSAAAVIGSAVVGAVAGTAIPFMLAGRKQPADWTHSDYSQPDPYADYRRGNARTAPWNRSWR